MKLPQQAAEFFNEARGRVERQKAVMKKEKNLTINVVTISELARLVYDRILTKGSSG